MLIDHLFSGSDSFVAAAITANTWTGTNSRDWHDPGNWSAGVVPDIDTNVTISDVSPVTNYPLINNALAANANTISITSSTIATPLEIQTFLDVRENIVNVAGAIKIRPTANIRQINAAAAANAGSFTLDKILNLRFWDDFSVGSPFFGGQALMDFFPNQTNKFWLYDGPVNLADPMSGWINVNPYTTLFDATTKGKGYCIQNKVYGSTTVPAVANLTYAGTPNNGTVNVGGQVNPGGKLVSNPYVSKLNSRAFLQANRANIEGTLHIWTNSTPLHYVNVNQNSDENYAHLNLFGSTKTSDSLAYPDEFIPPGESFMVECLNTAAVQFTNTQRVTPISVPNANDNNKNRLWLNFTPPSGLRFTNLLMGYVANNLLAAPTALVAGYNKGYDSRKLSINTFDMWVIDPEILPAAGNKMQISARAFSSYNAATSEFLLGFKTTMTGSHTIELDQFDGTTFSNPLLPITLWEWTGSAWVNRGDLKSGPISFTVNTPELNVEVSNRFKIKFSNT